MLPPAAVGVVTRPLPRLRLVDRPLVLKDRLGPSTIRAAVRRRVPVLQPAPCPTASTLSYSQHPGHAPVLLYRDRLVRTFDSPWIVVYRSRLVRR